MRARGEGVLEVIDDLIELRPAALAAPRARAARAPRQGRERR
jgi:hypothetical protein